MEVLELLNGGPGVLVSGVAAAILVAFVTGQLKAVLRPLAERLRGEYGSAYGDPTEDPWGLVAVVLGVAYAFLVASSEHAPDWLGDPFITVIYGVAIGFAATRARDVYDGVRPQ